MSARYVLLLCAQALFIQVITGACWGNAAWPGGRAEGGSGLSGPGLAFDAPIIEAAPCAGAAPFLGAGPTGYGPTTVAVPSGRGFVVSSASPIPPIGVSVTSDNTIEGILAIGGELPFLGTVGLEGILPTTGAGAVSYSCGNGEVGIVAEDVAPIAAGLPLAATGLGYGPAWAGGLGWTGRGLCPSSCSCGTPY